MKLDKITTGILNRSFTLDNSVTSNLDDRTLTFTFSSEAPCVRTFGIEVLDHCPTSVNLDRANSGSPLLLEHDPLQQIGIIEAAYIQDGKGVAKVRFSKSTKADEIYQDCLDNIRRNISVGYYVHEMYEDGAEGDNPIYRVTSWEVLEISVVSIPADITVGVGRGFDDKHETIVRNLEIETEINNNSEVIINEAEINTETVIEENSILDAETNLKEVNTLTDSFKPLDDTTKPTGGFKMSEQEVNPAVEILEIATKHNQIDLAKRAIAEGKTVAEFKGMVLETMGTPKPASTVELTAKEERQYSIINGINSSLNNTKSFEREISDEIAKKSGRETRGLLMPLTIGNRAGMSVSGSSGAAGGYTVATQTMPLIELLRNKLAVQTMGATFLSGLQGNIAFPRQSLANTLAWTTEGVDANNAGAMGFQTVPMSPRTAMATTGYTHQLLAQSSIDIENLVRQDLVTIMALGIDAAAIFGTGDNGQPLGLINVDGIGVVEAGSSPYADGNTLTWANVVALETAVAAKNADIENLGYLTNAKVRGLLKSTAKYANTGNPIWENDTVNGYKAFASNQVPSDLSKGSSNGILSAAIFGNWTDLIVGTWGNAVELIVDPYSLKKAGQVEITAIILCDVAIEHPESFAVCLDILA